MEEGLSLAGPASWQCSGAEKERSPPFGGGRPGKPLNGCRSFLFQSEAKTTAVTK